MRRHGEIYVHHVCSYMYIQDGVPLEAVGSMHDTDIYTRYIPVYMTDSCLTCESQYWCDQFLGIVVPVSGNLYL